MKSLYSCIALSALVFLGFATGVPHAAAAEKIPLPEASRIHFSHNWAGYVADEGAYTGVHGSWTVPTSTPEGTLSASAVWIGIGGSGSRDLIQLGTQALTNNGTTTYHAWYETLPDVERALPIAIAPGDRVSAALQEELPNLWHMIFRNDTAGTEYETYVYYVSHHDSAEWIVERPFAITERDTGYLPLSDFDTARFTNAGALTAQKRLVSLSSLTAADAAGPIMMDRSHASIQAAPSAVDENGFTVAYLDADEGEDLLDALKRRYRAVQTERAPKREVPLQTISPAPGTVIIRVVF